jgi:hypothetical protein
MVCRLDEHNKLFGALNWTLHDPTITTHEWVVAWAQCGKGVGTEYFDRVE